MFECPCVTLAISVALYYFYGFSLFRFLLELSPAVYFLMAIPVCLVVLQVVSTATFQNWAQRRRYRSHPELRVRM